MKELQNSASHLVPKQDMNTRWRGWVKQNALLYFALVALFSWGLTVFLSASFDAATQSAFGDALLIGIVGAMLLLATAILIWAQANKRNLIMIATLVLVGCISAGFFLLFGPNEVGQFTSSLSKPLMATRIMFFVPSVVALLATLVQALRQRRWMIVLSATILGFLGASTIYLANVQYQNRVNQTISYDYQDKATSYMNIKNYDAAIDAYTEALRLQPYDYGYLTGRARAKEAKGDYDAAIADYQLAIEHDSQAPDEVIYESIGDIYSDTRRYPQAISTYSDSLAANPYYLDAYEKRGDLYAKAGQKDKAISDYQASLKYDGVTYQESEHTSSGMILGPQSRNRIEGKITALGGVVPTATPSPTPHL